MDRYSIEPICQNYRRKKMHGTDEMPKIIGEQRMNLPKTRMENRHTDPRYISSDPAKRWNHFQERHP